MISAPVPVYIRAHHLLTSGNGVAELKWSSSNVFTLDANGKPVYDFTITDQTFDEFQRAGVRPMVELGFMPKDLAATVPGVTDYQVHYPGSTISGASNNPPKDYAVWGELVQKIHGAPCTTLWQGKGEHVVFRGLERAGYCILARHSGGVFQALRLCSGRGSRCIARSDRRWPCQHRSCF